MILMKRQHRSQFIDLLFFKEIYMEKNKVEAPQGCVFEMLNECKRQTKKNKLDFNICMCCILSRIEMHAYSIAKMLHQKDKDRIESARQNQSFHSNHKPNRDKRTF
jgi:sulfur relay (sulfurtransferase) complex TusBCD TusD component (DsrE family)